MALSYELIGKSLRIKKCFEVSALPEGVLPAFFSSPLEQIERTGTKPP